MWHEVTQPPPSPPPPGIGSLGLGNVILWRNSRGDFASQIFDLNAQIIGSAGIAFSDVEFLASPYTPPGTDGNIDANPQFENAAANIFRLVCGSPAINTGEDDLVLIDLFDLNQEGDDDDFNPDLDLRLRIEYVVDMGAYETQTLTCPSDVDLNCVIDVDDLIAVILSWGPCPTPPAACEADIDPSPCGNGDVNVDDMIAIILDWGACLNCEPLGTGAGGDPQDYADCEDLCEGKEGEDWFDCMSGCFFTSAQKRASRSTAIELEAVSDR